MEGGHPVTLLMFFTLTAGIVIGGGAFIYFLRHRHNRFIAAQALLGKDSRPDATPAPEGALPEIAGALAIAIVIMGLLLLGYSAR